MILWRNWGGWHALNVFFSLCLNARQPGKVFNRLNARQSEIFTEFPLKDSFELLDDMQSDSKNYVGLQDDEITEPVHTIKSACA